MPEDLRTCVTKEKPPLGLTAGQIWHRKVLMGRLNVLLEAIERYAVAGQPIPNEFVDEARGHFNRLISGRGE